MWQLNRISIGIISERIFLRLLHIHDKLSDYSFHVTFQALTPASCSVKPQSAEGVELHIYTWLQQLTQIFQINTSGQYLKHLYPKLALQGQFSVFIYFYIFRQYFIPKQ